MFLETNRLLIRTFNESDFADFRAVIARLFEEEETDYINLGHFDFNIPSRELQKKLGFIYLTTERFSEDGAEIVSIENILWRK